MLPLHLASTRSLSSSLIHISPPRSHFCVGRARLYSTRRSSPATTASFSTAVAAGEEADDDAAEADNARDDGLEDAADAGDNGHDAVTDRAEHALDL